MRCLARLAALLAGSCSNWGGAFSVLIKCSWNQDKKVCLEIASGRFTATRLQIATASLPVDASATEGKCRTSTILPLGTEAPQRGFLQAGEIFLRGVGQGSDGAGVGEHDPGGRSWRGCAGSGGVGRPSRSPPGARPGRGPDRRGNTPSPWPGAPGPAGAWRETMYGRRRCRWSAARPSWRSEQSSWDEGGGSSLAVAIGQIPVDATADAVLVHRKRDHRAEFLRLPRHVVPDPVAGKIAEAGRPGLGT